MTRADEPAGPHGCPHAAAPSHDTAGHSHACHPQGTTGLHHGNHEQMSRTNQWLESQHPVGQDHPSASDDSNALVMITITRPGFSSKVDPRRGPSWWEAKVRVMNYQAKREQERRKKAHSTKMTVPEISPLRDANELTPERIDEITEQEGDRRQKERDGRLSTLHSIRPSSSIIHAPYSAVLTKIYVLELLGYNVWKTGKRPGLLNDKVDITVPRHVRDLLESIGEPKASRKK